MGNSFPGLRCAPAFGRVNAPHHTKEGLMLKAFVSAVALSVALSGAALAADVEGQITSVDTIE